MAMSARLTIPNLGDIEEIPHRSKGHSVINVAKNPTENDPEDHRRDHPSVHQPPPEGTCPDGDGRHHSDELKSWQIEETPTGAIVEDRKQPCLVASNGEGQRLDHLIGCEDTGQGNEDPPERLASM